jgi:GGDEF domain-containing protein
MREEDSLAALDSTAQSTAHAAVNCYLSTIEAAAQALAKACPAIGRPYEQRLSRLRARLAFDSGVDQIEESRAAAALELHNYAEQASAYAEQQRAELRRALAGLEEMVNTQAQRQEFYGERVRRLAMQLEQQHATETARFSQGLENCVESMSHESQSLLRKMRDEMASLETRLAGIEITDRVTGLINRSEMERIIAAAKARGETPVLLLFDFRDSLLDDVARQVSARLGSQFRYPDLISRWSERQFLVAFRGSLETARRRGEQILPWIAGRYQLEGGAVVEAAVEARLIDEARLSEAEVAAY